MEFLLWLQASQLSHVIAKANHMLVASMGVALSVTSGAFMFVSAPLHYYANWAFDTKMGILLAAFLVYALIFAWRPAQVRAHIVLARIHILVSLTLWIMVCMAGRAIGFV